MIFQIQICHGEINRTRRQISPESRKNNVRIDGIPETLIETLENCEEEVMKIIFKKIDITDNIKIDRFPRMSKF